MRRASAWSTEDARPTANCSSAEPPASIRTTSTPARYSPRNAAVTIEIAASRSEPNCPAHALRTSPATSGRPPPNNTRYSGTAAAVGDNDVRQRSTRCTASAATAPIAITPSRVKTRRSTSRVVVPGAGTTALVDSELTTTGTPPRTDAAAKRPRYPRQRGLRPKTHRACVKSAAAVSDGRPGARRQSRRQSRLPHANCRAP